MLLPMDCDLFVQMTLPCCTERFCTPGTTQRGDAAIAHVCNDPTATAEWILPCCSCRRVVRRCFCRGRRLRVGHDADSTPMPFVPLAVWCQCHSQSPLLFVVHLRNLKTCHTSATSYHDISASSACQSTHKEIQQLEVLSVLGCRYSVSFPA